MILILGANGNLGSALFSQLKDIDDILILDRTFVSELANQNYTKSQAKFFDRMKVKPRLVIVAAGVTDSTLPIAYHQKINYLLPRNILEIGILNGFRTITFGSIHEDSQIMSNYMISKRMYRDLLKSNSLYSFHHFQLNTLFSRTHLAPKSFLGQLKNSIEKQTFFEMSSGAQLRQFHLTETVVHKIVADLRRSVNGNQITALSSGQIFSLYEVAKYLLDKKSSSHLLRRFAKSDPEHEVYDSTFFDTYPINLPKIDNPLDNIFETLLG